jgi:hypothetical protein
MTSLSTVELGFNAGFGPEFVEQIYQGHAPFFTVFHCVGKAGTCENLKKVGAE